MHNSSLNHTFRLIWSAGAGAYVAVAETTRGKGKGGRSGRVASVVLAAATLAGNAFADAPPGLMLNGINTVNSTGASKVIDGGGSTGYFVQSGIFTINDATLQNFQTKGGSGSGGGAGLGGAVFVNSGAIVTLNNVNFFGNAVIGGSADAGSTSGGSINNFPNTGLRGSTGEDGLSAPAQSATVTDGTGWNGYKGAGGGSSAIGFGLGGNGGNGGNGSNGISPEATAAYIKEVADKVLDVAASANDGTEAGIYTTLATSLSAAAAAASAGANVGGPTTAHLAPFLTAQAAEFTAKATAAGVMEGADIAKIAADVAYMIAMRAASADYGVVGSGGEGGGGGSGGNGSDFFGGGKGGNGGSGGDAYSISKAIGGPGGDGGDGGKGGFGAGGGSGGNGGNDGINGNDVANGDALGAGGAGGAGGFGAGQGASGRSGEDGEGGSGGSGYGGAIFVRKNGTLHITGTATFDKNAALGGDGQVETARTLGGAAGSAAGTDLYMMKGSTVILAPGKDNVITFNGTIADDSGTTGVADGNGASLTVRDGLVIFNGANTYSGQTKIAAGGVLQAQDGTGISTSSNINLTGGVLQANGLFDRFVGTASPRVQWTGDGGFAAQGGALEVKLSNNATLIWGSNSFVPDGNKLLFGSRSATDAVTFDNAINLNNSTRTILVTANDAAVSGVDANIDTATLNGVVSNGGLIVGDNTHTGILILNKSNTYTGGTTVNGGTLRESATGYLADTGFLTVDGSTAVFDLGENHNDTVGTITLDHGGTLAGTGTSTLTSTGTSEMKDGTVNIILAGTGPLNKTTGGTVTLNNKNTYTGATTVSAGKLQYGTNDAIASGTVTVNGPTAELALGGYSDTVGTVTLDNGGLISGTGTLTSTGSFEVKDGTVNAVLGGAGIALNKTTAGTVILNNKNTYTGATTVSAGKLQYGTNDAIASGTVNVNGPTAELALGGYSDTVGTVTLDNGGLISGTGTLTSTGSFEMKSGTVNTVLGGSGIALNKTTAGTVILNNKNTYTGNTNVMAGKLILAGATTPNLASSTAVIVASGANLVVNGNNTVASLTSNGTVSGNKTLTAPIYNLNNGTIISAKLGNVSTPSGSTVNTNGAVTFSNTVAANTINVLTGLLTLNGADLLSHEATLGIASVAALALTGGDQTIGTLNGSGKLTLNGYNLNVTKGGSYSGSTTSSGNLNKTGDGTLTLSGDNTFNEGTTVNTGTVAVTSTGSLGTKDTVVNKGGTLVNNGTVNSNVLVNVGGILKGSGTITGDFTGNGITAPGNSPGILSVAGNYSENGTLQIEVGGLSGPGVNPTGHDQMAVGGKTVLNAGSSALQVIKYTAFEPSKGDAFTIIKGAPGSISGSFATFTSGLTNDTILNRSTGQLIGTGLLTASTGSNILNAFPGATSNLQSMLNDLKIGDHQYAGGDLLPLLLSAGLSASDVGVIGNRASPEAYAGFSDYASRSLGNYADSATSMTPLAKTEKYAIFAGYTSLDTGSSSSANQADYTIKSKGAVTGARIILSPDWSAGLFIGIDSGSMNSTYTSGNVKGNVYGLFGEYVGGDDRKLTVTGSFSMASYTSDGARMTAGTGLATPGLSRFKDVGSSANMASVAVKYRALERPDFSIQPELRLSYTTGNVDRFTETNANALQALNVHSQSSHNLTTEAAISGNFLVNSNLSLNGRVGLSHNSGTISRGVAANVVSEAESFSVRAPGMGNTALNLAMGANYRVTDKFTVGASYRRSVAKNAQDSNAFYVHAAVSF